MKRDLYLQVGGFDENCFMYSDDIDLSYLVKKAGFKNYYFHETSVIHYKGESTVRDEKYVKRFSEAMQFFYKKHFGGSWFFDVFMKIGIFFFVLFKKNQQKENKGDVNLYLLISEEDSFKESFDKHVKFQKMISDNLFEMSAGIEVVLDNNSYSFKDIIAFLENNRNKGYTFKIIPQSSNFMIGSNHANDIGEVINLTKID